MAAFRKSHQTPGSDWINIMANTLPIDQQEQIRSLYLAQGSIKAVAKALGCSRNTIRKLIRAEGLMPACLETKPTSVEAHLSVDLHPMAFEVLGKLFELGREVGENLNFEKHIKGLAVSIAKEIGINQTVDKVRPENAMLQYITFRRFYVKSLHCSDKAYSGPHSKSHEKLAKTVGKWVETSNRALDSFNRLIRELEVKYGKRSPDFGRGNIYLTQNQLNIAAQK